MFEHVIDDHLRLRPLQTHHADALFALTDANRAYLREWLPWLDMTTKPEHTRAFIQGTMDAYARTQAWIAGIWVDGTLAGVIGHNRIDWPNRVSYPGYWLGEPFRGRGVMTRACRALVDDAFRGLGLNRVVIEAATGNARSVAIPRRLGFALEGTLHDREWLYDHYVDHHLFAMLKRDWPSMGPQTSDDA